MSRKALRSGDINEQRIKETFTKCKGDLFVSAAYLGLSPLELDRCIKASDELQAFVSAIGQVKVMPAYAEMSAKQFSEELVARTQGYALDGLEVIHEIAMGEAEDAASRKVKLDAAIALRGSHVEQRQDSELDRTLHELNRLYHEHAPKITQIRQTTITIQGDLSQAEPRLINP